MTHMIRQEYLHVQVNGTESDALALQRTLPGLCQHWLAPAIERAFERGAPPVGHLCIERLEIDVGTVQLERLEVDLAESVARELEKALREQTPPEETRPSLASGNIRHKTEQRSIDDAFIHFLTTGSLPWSFHLPKGSTLEQVMLHSRRGQSDSSAMPEAAQHVLLRALASSTVRARLVRQFSSAFLETMLSLLSPEAKKILAGVMQAVSFSAAPKVDRKCLERQLWETVFAEVATGNVPTSLHLAGKAWSALPDTAKGQAALGRALEGQWPGSTGKAWAAAGGDRTAAERIAPGSGSFPASRKPAPNPGEHPEAGEGIYIGNAGVILLHPFLPQLFETAGIAAGDELLQPERALCLLHFLATGQTIAPEYELMLPKILCNVPLETPVEADAALTAGEREEAAALLEAVIRHWDALRNTSPDALRGNYLLRPGKISLRGGDWLLQVESETCDILLDQLPWGISPIRLPWMGRMLWVEWR